MKTFRSLSVATLSKLIVLSILVIGLMISALAIWGVNRTDRSIDLMQQVSRRADPATTAMSELVRSLGYGGMIHGFKNYVLRGDEIYYRAANQNAGAALSAVERMINLGAVSGDEAQPVIDMIDNYTSQLSAVRNLRRYGQSAAAIDTQVSVDDGPALAMLGALREAKMSQNATSDGAGYSKAEALSDLRFHMGYGGMIHNFKNLVLRRDLPRIEKLKANFAESRTAIDKLAVLDLSASEQDALRDITATIAEYEGKISDIEALIAENASPKTIDGAVSISDASALAGLSVFEAAVAAEAVAISEEMREAQTTFRSLLIPASLLVVITCLFTALANGFVLRRGVVDKQTSADAEAARMHQEREDFQTRTSLMAEAASRGDFSRRINAAYTDDTLTAAAAHLDQLMANTEAGLAAAIDVSNAMAQGDLTHRMSGDFQGAFGELQSTLNNALSSISRLIQNVVRNSKEISSYTDSISSETNNLSARTETQATNLASSTAALHDLTQSVQDVSARVAAARTQAESAHTVAQTGASVVTDAVAAMDRIVETSLKISKVTEMIEDIAFQTNLLALNAGVEAARAGESGLGFAVVASEVRALALRSSDAAKDINDLIIASETEIGEGARQIAEAGTSIRDISGHVADLDRSIDSIAHQAEDQAVRLADVNSAVHALEGVTQQNAAMFEETAASIDSLHMLTDDLVVTSTRFTVGADTETSVALAKAG